MGMMVEGLMATIILRNVNGIGHGKPHFVQIKRASVQRNGALCAQ